MEKKKVCYIPYVSMKNKDAVFHENKNSWEYELRKQLESDQAEIHTYDMTTLEESDYFVFFDNLYYQNLDWMWRLYHAKKLHNTIYLDYEPPTGHCKIHTKTGLKRLSKIFKSVITYNDDIIDGEKIIKGNIGNFYSKELPYQNDFAKRKLLVMINNNTGDQNIAEIMNFYNSTDHYNVKNLRSKSYSLYAERNKIATYFLNTCPTDFDLYGTLWGDEFKPVLKGFTERDKKCKTLQKYRFAIAFDSYKDQNGYISEKIFDCFNAKTVPIYWGADNVTDYIPKECFIDRRDFQDYDDLYCYLIQMTEKEYNQKIKAMETYLHSKKYEEFFSSKASATIIKKELQKEPTDYSYELAYKELVRLQKTRVKLQKRRKVNFYMTQILEEGCRVELTFYIPDYTHNINSRYSIHVDGKEVTPTEIIELECPAGGISYEMKCIIEWKGSSIKVEFYHEDEKKAQKCIPIGGDNKYCIEYGLVASKRKRQFIYYNYHHLSKIQKLKYVLFIRPSRLFAIIKLQFLDKLYRLTQKCRRTIKKMKEKNSLGKVGTIVVRLLRLLLVYIKHIIDIFKWDGQI